MNSMSITFVKEKVSFSSSVPCQEKDTTEDNPINKPDANNIIKLNYRYRMRCPGLISETENNPLN